MADATGPTSATDAAAYDDDALARLRRRTVGVLASGQILGGIAFGATISLGAVLAADISGDEAFSGLATALVTLGTAALAVPLAALARRSGRRIALAGGMLIALVGVAVVILAAGVRVFPLLLAGFALIGAGQAANLQSRFAAVDLATAASRGRDLSLVVWATTIGAVLGPNLVGPGEALGDALGMPPLTGPYVFTVVAQILAVALYLAALRPDPLLVATRIAGSAATGAAAGIARADRPRAAAYAIVAIAGAHGVMVAVMAMTPVHLLHHGADLEIIGLTISLHIAGMYALAPVFGVLADRLGRIPTILLGQALLTAALLTAAVGQESGAAVTVALVLLGLGWSASTVAGSTLLTESSAESLRTRRQGRSDLAMSLVGGLGAIGAGFVLGAIGYGGLALVALIVVAAVTVLAPYARAAR
ncbi:MFS transporter [Microbacterium aurum]|uniref:MFS transporter n=1 Tax=Microbacterium aurum TaxID=36805 RepID=A0A1P8U821_9MICO|nr:MFS transporter [Microbacterium aurum]APZ34225.1 MFS transporter [Microbacterium aurum]MBM7828056.1 MFS family permease [Microbacterium aurum]